MSPFLVIRSLLRLYEVVVKAIRVLSDEFFRVGVDAHLRFLSSYHVDLCDRICKVEVWPAVCLSFQIELD